MASGRSAPDQIIRNKVFAWPLVGIVMFVIGVFIGCLAIMTARDKGDEPEEAQSVD